MGILFVVFYLVLICALAFVGSRFILGIYYDSGAETKEAEENRVERERLERQMAFEEDIFKRYSATEEEHEHCSKCSWPLYGDEVVMVADEPYCRACLADAELASKEEKDG